MFILSFVSLYALLLVSSHGFLRKENNATFMPSQTTLMPSQTTLMPSLENNATIVVVPFSVAVANNCTNDADCNYDGVCNSENKCNCNNGYITFPTDHAIGCNYKQKSARVALLLQCLLGWFSGAGYFYLGNIYIGLGFSELCIFMCCLVVLCELNKKHKFNSINIRTPLIRSEIDTVIDNIKNILYLLTICIFWGLWILPMVLINNKILLDGNGAPLVDNR